MKRSALAICAVICLTLVACGTVDRLRPGAYGKPLRSARMTFEGYDFRARSRHASEDRRAFTVALKKAQRSTLGAYQAAEFEANKYCLGLFGVSDHELDANPEIPEAELPVDSGGTWVVSGRCTARS